MDQGREAVGLAGKKERGLASLTLPFRTLNPENVEKRARKAIKRGHLKEAAAICELAVGSRVASPALLLTLGEIYQMMGLPQQAAEKFVQAIELDPGMRRGYQKLMEIYREQNALEEAIPIFQKFYNEFPQYPQPQNYYATTLLFTGQFQEAGRLLEDLCIRHAGYGACHNNLGILRFYQGRFAEAEREYKTALSIDESSSGGSILGSIVYGNLAEIRAWKGDFDGAVEYCNAGIAFGPTSILYVNLGNFYEAKGMAEEAIKAYEKSFMLEDGVPIDGVWVEALGRLARLYLKLNQPDQAAAACQTLLEKRPANVGIHKILGDVYFQKGFYLQAVEEYRTALSLEPSSLKNLKIHKSLALAYYKAGMFDKATAEFRRISLFHPERFFINVEKPVLNKRELSPDKEIAWCREALIQWPDDTRLRVRLADAYVQQGRLEEAVAEYRQALEQDPMDTDSLIKLGMVHLAEEEFWKAIHCFARVLEINPSSAPAYTGLGCVALERGTLNHAILLLKRAVGVDAQYPDAHNYLGNAFRILKRLEAAIEEYRTAVRLYPGYAQAHNNLGVALLEKGEVHQAIASFREAVRLFPESVSALCHIGEGYFRLGQFEEAKEALEEALHINPYNARAQSLLEEIYMNPAGGRPFDQ